MELCVKASVLGMDIDIPSYDVKLVFHAATGELQNASIALKSAGSSDKLLQWDDLLLHAIATNDVPFLVSEMQARAASFHCRQTVIASASAAVDGVELFYDPSHSVDSVKFLMSQHGGKYLCINLPPDFPIMEASTGADQGTSCRFTVTAPQGAMLSAKNQVSKDTESKCAEITEALQREAPHSFEIIVRRLRDVFGAYKTL